MIDPVEVRLMRVLEVLSRMPEHEQRQIGALFERKTAELEYQMLMLRLQRCHHAKTDD